MAGSVGSEPEEECEVPTRRGAQNRITSFFANIMPPLGKARWQTRTHEGAAHGRTTQPSAPIHPTQLLGTGRARARLGRLEASRESIISIAAVPTWNKPCSKRLDCPK